MSQVIIVFSIPVECDRLQGRRLDEETAAEFASPSDWQFASRNGWYQDLVSKVIEAYRDFHELEYLTNRFALILKSDLAAKILAINRLLATIRDNTEPFLEITRWYGASADEVRKNLAEAKVSREFDDDYIYAFSNFFTFLTSHAAALEEANSRNLCLLHAAFGW